MPMPFPIVYLFSCMLISVVCATLSLSTLAAQASPSAQLAEKVSKQINENAINEIEAGLVLTSGNSDSQIVTVSGQLQRQQHNWLHTVNGDIYSAAYNSNRTAESYRLELMSRYDLPNQRYWFANARYFDDKFDSFKGIASAAAGAGFQPLNHRRARWDVFAGLGYSAQRRESNNADISGATFLGLSSYHYQLTDNTDVAIRSRFEYLPDNTYIRNTASLKVAINSTLSVRLGYELRYNARPDRADENIDTITKANLVYAFD